MTRPGSSFPRELGPYQVLGLLGRGAMGAVLRAEHRDLKRPVAIKILPDEHRAMRMLRHRFRREARAMSLVDHPNIVGILDAELDHEPPYIVMELVEGSSLEGRVGPTARPWERDDVLELGTQLAQGLAAIHRAGLVHRDIKPANVLRDEARGSYRIADLGLAGGTRFTVLTKEGDILGTPAYLAPEAWVREGSTPASDVFQVGVLLYEAWIGDTPYGRTLESLMVNVQKGLAPDDRIGTAPLAQVIRGCLEVDPTRRYASGRELLRALQAVGRADRSQETSGVFEVLPAPLPPPPLEVPAVLTRRRILAMVVAAALGVGAGLLSRAQEAGPEAAVAAPGPPELAVPPRDLRGLRPEGLRVRIEGPDVELVFRTAAARRSRLVVDGGAPRAEGPRGLEHRLRVAGLPALRGWPRAVLELVDEDGRGSRWPLPGGLAGHAELLEEAIGELTREVWELARGPWQAGRLATSPGRLALVERLVERGLVGRAEGLGRGVRAFLADPRRPLAEKWLLYQALGELAALEAIGPDPARARPLLGVESWVEPLVRAARAARAPAEMTVYPQRPSERPVKLAPRELVGPGGEPDLVDLASEVAVALPPPLDRQALFLMVELSDYAMPGLVLELEGAGDLRLPARDAQGRAGELVGWRLAPGTFGPRGRRAVLRLAASVPGALVHPGVVRALRVWVHSGP